LASTITALGGADRLYGDPLFGFGAPVAATLVSAPAGAVSTGAVGRHGVFSPDGRYVAFLSDTNGGLVPGVSGMQVYVKEIASGTVWLASAWNGAPGAKVAPG
jgi:hypothetical protein